MAEHPERHWFQFNLQTLLAGMLLSAIVAWLITRVHNPIDLLVIGLLTTLIFFNRLPEILRKLRDGPPGGPGIS